mgnify:CR=1 FL=1
MISLRISWACPPVRVEKQLRPPILLPASVPLFLPYPSPCFSPPVLLLRGELKRKRDCAVRGRSVAHGARAAYL